MTSDADFDFEAFSVSAIQVIDEIRSYGKDGSKNPIEPRINAFYRAIGLPAVVAKKSTQEKNRLNNGNTFDYETLKYDDYQANLSLRKNSFKMPPTDEEIDNFLLYNTNNISDGIKDNSEQGFRLRGTLRPMVVDGEISIYPQECRVANAFTTDKDLKVGTVVYRRPLIETIISMRLKTEGLQDQVLQQKISNDFGPNVSNDLKLLAGQIEASIVNTTNGLNDVLGEAVQVANKLKGQLSLSLVPTVANIAQQSLGISTTTPKITGELDKQKIAQQNALNIKRGILNVLEYDDTFSTEKKDSRNIKNGLLATNLLSLVGAGLGIDGNAEKPGKLQQDINDTNRKIEKQTRNLRELYRTMDLLLGTFSGISGVDIIVVLAALFDINLQALIGLLNKNAQENLVSFKGENSVQGALKVSDSIKALEESVIKIYKKIENDVSQNKHINKVDNQE